MIYIIVTLINIGMVIFYAIEHNIPASLGFLIGAVCGTFAFIEKISKHEHEDELNLVKYEKYKS